MSIQQNYGNIKPSLNLDFANTKQLDPRITYSRASTGTYYDGKAVAKAEENLLTASQEFETGYWVQESITVTANSTVAPDGTTTADSLIEDSSNNSHMVRGASTANVGLTFTMSVFAKPNGRDFLHLSYNAGAGGYYAHATFNVSTGIVTASGAVGWSFVSAAITPASNGFYRCSLTFTPTTNAGASPCFCTSNTGTPALNSVGRPVYTGSGASGIFIWGAQLEQRSFATAYTPTTTAPITNYIPVLQTASAGTPRFDHNPITGESLGLLIEEQRTNLLLQSETFENVAWTKISTTITANTVVAPDGTLTGDKLASSTVSVASHQDYQIGITITNAATYTWSVYMKQGEYTWGIVNAYSATDSRTYFNLATGTVGTVAAGSTATITPVGNGWYRCSVTRTSAAATGGLSIEMTNADNVPSFAANVGSGIYIWGAQLEAGAFATSYIPTVASQVTRAADSASMTGTNFSSWYNAGEGTTYIDAVAGLNGSYGFSISDGSNNNYIVTGRYASSGTAAVIAASGSIQANFGSGALSAKVALGYRVNDFAVSSNGGAAATDTSGLIPIVDRLRIGASQDGSIPLNGTIKKLSYDPRRLTNTQIQSLTT